MDVIERLPLEGASAHTLLVCEHRHRYEFARELCRDMRVLDLCCGSGYGSALLAETATKVVGVDNDAAVIDSARAAIRDDSVSFVASDARAYLESGAGDRFDAIVCFEGLEHLPELELVLASLRRHADAGIKLVASVPNSKLFEEENPYHVTDFSYESAIAAFSDFPDVVVVPQYLAEGSVMCPPGATSIDFTFLPQDRLEVAYANHFIFCIGFQAAAVLDVHRGRVQVEAAPVHNRYMRNLEAANVELRRANARLARTHLATTGSAAATQLFRAGEEISARDAALLAANARAQEAEQDRDAWKQRCLASHGRQPNLVAGADTISSTAQPRSGLTSSSGTSALHERPVRATRLEVHEVADGLVIYQDHPERVHYLNNTAAVVFDLCDGEKLVSTISAQVAAVFGLAEPPEDLVGSCIADLRAKGVLR